MSKTERNKLYRINNDRKHSSAVMGSQQTSGNHKHHGHSHSHDSRHANKSGMRRHLIEQIIKREGTA